jgi:tRNA(fMet)-specific endonuclease VapC
MLIYMLDTNICIYVMKHYPPQLRQKFNELAEQLCISSITLGELHYGVEKSARRAENLTAVENFAARREGGRSLRPVARRTGTRGHTLRPP